MTNGMPWESVLMLGSPRPTEPSISMLGLNVAVDGGAALAGRAVNVGSATAPAAAATINFLVTIPGRILITPFPGASHASARPHSFAGSKCTSDQGPWVKATFGVRRFRPVPAGSDAGPPAPAGGAHAPVDRPADARGPPGRLPGPRPQDRGPPDACP